MSPGEASASLGFYARYLMRREYLTGFCMRIKQAGVWINTIPLIKHAGTWKKPVRYLIKEAGRWIEFVYRGILNNLYAATVTVGSVNAGSYIQYGFNVIVANPYGNTSHPYLKSGHRVHYMITGNKDFTGVGPNMWIEMAVEGNASGIYAGDITINGKIGRLVRNAFLAEQNRTYLNWSFDVALPTSGQWVINT